MRGRGNTENQVKTGRVPVQPKMNTSFLFLLFVIEHFISHMSPHCIISHFHSLVNALSTSSFLSKYAFPP